MKLKAKGSIFVINDLFAQSIIKIRKTPSKLTTIFVIYQETGLEI